MQTIEAVQSMDINTWAHGPMPHLLYTSKGSYEDVTARLDLVVAENITRENTNFVLVVQDRYQEKENL